MIEPVATLPACLCGLDANPVASPRMDIHCPKHDAPEAGGERPRAFFDAGFARDGGELPCPLCRKPMDILENGQAWCRNLIENPNDYAEWAEGSCLLACNSVTLPIEVWRAVNAAHADTRVSQPADWLKDKEIERLKDERNQLAQQSAELWERANTDQPAGGPSDEDEAWIRRLAQRIRHHQMKGYDMYTEDHLVASITDEYQKRRTVAQPLPATVPAFKNSKEAMLYAQRNNIPTVIPVSVAAPPTPADEEVARDVVTTWVNRYIGKAPNSGTYAELEQRITTALAEARRAQREEDAQLADSWEHEDKVNPARWIASAIRQQVPAQGTPTTDARAKSVVDHLFTILARDYNIELTNNDASELTETVASALSSTPSDEVAQRARAVKIRTAAEDVWNKFWNDLTSDGWSVDDLEAILRLHFTATDVERETCTEHEK